MIPTDSTQRLAPDPRPQPRPDTTTPIESQRMPPPKSRAASGRREKVAVRVFDCSLPLRPTRVHGVGPALKVHKEGVRVASFGENYSVRVTARHGPTVGSRLKRSTLDSDLSTLLARFVGRLRVKLVVGRIGMLRGWRTDLPQHPPARGAGRHDQREQAQRKGL